MSSRQQIDSVIDDDDEFWYEIILLDDYATWKLTYSLAPFVSKSLIFPTRTSNHVLAVIRYVLAETKQAFLCVL